MNAIRVDETESTELTLLEYSNMYMEKFFEETSPTLADMKEIQQYMASDDYAAERIYPEAKHTFSSGLYARELTVPAGALVFGKKHAKSHITILASGKATIVTRNGIETVEGPAAWTDEPGIERAVYAYTDSTFLTVHATTKTDLEDIEKEIIEGDNA